MDFLKSLMIYMSVLFMMGVENAEMPASMPTPRPTVAPTAIATTEPEGAKATKGPTATPGQPTMTPNNKYSTLRSGDRNNNVKKMQQRLIELGYMKKGTADGKYGGQTVTAVRNFQKNNGLRADGVAGKATLTHLYEDKNVVYASATPTPTPKAKATAKATAKAGTKATAKATAAPKKTNAAQPKATEAAVSSQSAADTTTAGWFKTGAKVLLNETALMILEREDTVTTSRAPAVYVHDGAVIVSLTELAKAADWQLDGQTEGRGFTLKAMGYEVTAVYQQNDFSVKVNGKSVEVPEQSIFWSDGVWLADTAVLKQTMNANITWDQDENTLVIRITEKSLAESDD